MVAKDGIVIFDDYEFDQMEGELERPKLGVDVFLASIDRAVPARPQRLSGRHRQAVARYFRVMRNPSWPLTVKPSTCPLCRLIVTFTDSSRHSAAIVSSSRAHSRPAIS